VTCKNFASLILDYLEHDLDRTILATFEHHLLTCPNCGLYLTQYLATITLGRRAFLESPRALPVVSDNLVASILAASRIYAA
jgi:hypothetical protein